MNPSQPLRRADEYRDTLRDSPATRMEGTMRSLIWMLIAIFALRGA
jgi:hypothetical protein